MDSATDSDEDDHTELASSIRFKLFQSWPCTDIDSQLKHLDREAWPTDDDGNSFFVSIARQVHNMGATHASLRKTFYKTGKQFLEKYICFSSFEGDKKTTLQNVRRMKADGIWVPELKDMAMAILQDELNIDILIIKDEQWPDFIISDKEENLYRHFVVMIERNAAGHYDATEPTCYSAKSLGRKESIPCPLKIKKKSKLKKVKTFVAKPFTYLKKRLPSRRQERQNSDVSTESSASLDSLFVNLSVQEDSCIDESERVERNLANATDTSSHETTPTVVECDYEVPVPCQCSQPQINRKTWPKIHENSSIPTLPPPPPPNTNEKMKESKLLR